MKTDTFFGYKKLIVWERADELAHLIYDLTLSFPKDEVFGLTSQLRRAGLSIVLNIVEGQARNNKKEFHRFLAISLSSLAEVEYLLEFSLKRKYLKQNDFDKALALKESTGQLLWKLYISQK
jgi:four helix bundle protein